MLLNNKVKINLIHNFGNIYKYFIFVIEWIKNDSATDNRIALAFCYEDFSAGAPDISSNSKKKNFY